jgi:FkbM family methyltransferase
MMQLSYAQNLEDYHLDLVFAGQASGTYVDVGGGHPVADNVTYYFYLKGWRGLIVEPQAALARAYAHIRPRDVTVSCLAGRSDGTIPFHEVEGLHGLSSAVAANAERAGQYGAKFRTIEKPVRRLSRLIDEAKLSAIDVLKIDVEGAEPDVLAGLDLKRHRPKLVLVEAINPNNPEADAAAWEPMLLTSGYSFVFFDNLNRFYVADEARALAERLPPEPAPWDKVDHLWDHGRAARTPKHGDHVLAMALEHGFHAMLPELDPALLRKILERGLALRGLDIAKPETLTKLAGTIEDPSGAAPAKDLAQLLASDRIRAALGRIACMYDGGHVVEEPASSA